MDGLPLAVPFVVGIILRFGVPLLLTFGAAWLLRLLDERWQSEVERGEAPAGDGVRALRCWVLKDCPEDTRAGCPAYQDRSIPCWQHFRDERGRLAERCLSCQIFRRQPVPEPV